MIEETPEDQAEWMRKRQTDPDDWLGWGFLALWAAVIAVIIWKNASAVLTFVIAVGPVVAFYWWAYRRAKKRESQWRP